MSKFLGLNTQTARKFNPHSFLTHGFVKERKNLKTMISTLLLFFATWMTDATCTYPHTPQKTVDKDCLETEITTCPEEDPVFILEAIRTDFLQQLQDQICLLYTSPSPRDS